MIFEFDTYPAHIMLSKILMRLDEYQSLQMMLLISGTVAFIKLEVSGLLISATKIKM